jgi:hypothetical protein
MNPESLPVLDALHSTPALRYLASDPIPGYPAKGRWAEPRRLPVEDVVHWDRWGARRSREEG